MVIRQLTEYILGGHHPLFESRYYSMVRIRDVALLALMAMWQRRDDYRRLRKLKPPIVLDILAMLLAVTKAVMRNRKELKKWESCMT